MARFRPRRSVPPRQGREPGPDPAADRRLALGLVPVSRETEAAFSVYAELLGRWQLVKNLVGPSTLGQIWTRHIADSAQLLEFAPDAKTWADMGSGAGFPGMVVAIQMRGRAGAAVHLIESNARKCAFLREAARACDAPAFVHNARVEDVLPEIANLDAITARAVAPLPLLLEMGKIPLDQGAVGLFLKSEAEIAATDLAALGVRCAVHPSKTSREGRVILVRRGEAASAVADRTRTEGFPA